MDVHGSNRGSPIKFLQFGQSPLRKTRNIGAEKQIAVGNFLERKKDGTAEVDTMLSLVACYLNLCLMRTLVDA